METFVTFYPIGGKRESALAMFVAKGELGAVNFSAVTGWSLLKEDLHKSYAHTLGYHSPKPMYGGHEVYDASCPFLDGKPCYCGCAANYYVQAAEEPFEILINSGSEAMWAWMEEYYEDVFGIG